MLERMERYTDLALLLLRVGVGLIFLAHGAQKLFGAWEGPGLQGTAGFLGRLGFAPAIFWAWVLALVEFFGGLLVLVGVLTRWASFLLVVDMGVAIAKVHAAKGFFGGKGGFEFPLLIACTALSLFLLGAGRYSLEAVFKKPKAPPASQNG